MSKHMSESVRVPIEQDNPSIERIEEKCVKCGKCRDVCRDYIGVHSTYNLSDNFDTAICINCGQCANVCPTSSIIEKYEYAKVQQAIDDAGKVVVVSTSPSVRVSLGEEFGYPAGSDVQGKMIGLLRTLGADYVLDTNFGADLTIMEEAEEFVKRFNKHDHLPQFTSCCPAWVKYVETYHHELLPNLSTAKSPIGMQGATIKTYFANKMGIDPRKIVHVALTPCTAKKMEVRRAGLGSAGEMLGIKGMRDTDYVITTRELAIWAKERNIDFDSVQDSNFDKYMGQSSGAGYIFANSGGVMEAALRAAYQLITHKRPPEKLYDLTEVRGYDSVKAASLIIQGTTINVAVIYGTANAEKFLKNMNKGGVEYHFIEVMTCPGGCIGGGGQPISENPDEVRKARQATVYKYDELSELKTSRDNPEIKDVYSGFFDKPGSTTAQKLLHTTYCKRKVNLKTTPQ